MGLLGFRVLGALGFGALGFEDFLGVLALGFSSTILECFFWGDLFLKGTIIS